MRIQQSFLLNERFELPEEGLDKVVSSYKKKWNHMNGTGGEAVVKGLEKVTGLTFAHNILEVYIANPQNRSSISNPLIIGGGYTPTEFMHVLTHELTHILADDNKQDYNWHEVAKKLYPKKEKMVAYHIMTHCIMEGLYTEVLKKPDWVIWLIKNAHVFTRRDTHEEAWKVIDDNGYEKILQSFKDNSFKTDKKFA